MSSKEIKSRLKAAKAAIDKQEFDSALEHCQTLFQLDEKHYTGLVFAGLASLKLGQYAEARKYYKDAVSVQPDGALAWKGFADYHDKHRPVVKDEQLEAIETYTKLITFIENDKEKLRAANLKLVSLHKEFNHQNEVIACYDAALETYNNDTDSDDASSCSELWMEYATYVLNRDAIPANCWDKLRCGFPVISESERKQELRGKLVKRLYARFLGLKTVCPDTQVFLEEESCSLVTTNPLAAIPVYLHLLLMQALPSFVDDLVARPLPLSEQQLEQLCKICPPDSARMGDDSGSGLQRSSVWWAGHALKGVADRKWMEARNMIRKGVGYPPVSCECWYLSSLLHLCHRDYKDAESAADSGLISLSSTAKFKVSELEKSLKLCQCEAYIGRGSVKQLQQALPYLAKVQAESHDSHVTAILVKAHLLLGDAASAQSVLGSVDGREESSPFLLALQGEVLMAERDFTNALATVDSALKLHPSSPRLLFTRARVLWEDPELDKTKAYPALLQAAKVDPMNPDIFLHLGHYQKLITGDLKRAEKCYQKAFSLQPSHSEAATSLGDILWTSGKEEEAYEVYKALTANAIPSRAKVAWLRIGLYQKKVKQYTEAIKSFQTILSSFPEDKHCWECLGETYLARGSHNSAMKTFTKCIELDPNSTHCLYQIAYIKQLLGLFQEALVDYSSVLDKEENYVPALKGTLI